MPEQSLSSSDKALIDEATTVLQDKFDPARHHVASALRTASDRTYTAINLVPSVGAAEIHCEPITIGMAIMNDETDFDASVAVYYPDHNRENPPTIISACGVCRELIRDFDPSTEIIVPGDPEPKKYPVTDLLPEKS